MKEFLHKELEGVAFAKNEKILLFTHSVIMSAFFSDDHTGYKHFENCQIAPYFYEGLHH